MCKWMSHFLVSAALLIATSTVARAQCFEDPREVKLGKDSEGKEQIVRAPVFSAMALLIGTGLLIGPVAEGQAPSERQAPAATPTINLTVEQRHIIKEIVKDMKIENASGELQLSIGTIAPQNLDLQSFPPEVIQKVPQVRNHNFFMKDNRIVIVSPKDNTIVDVID